MSKFKLKYICLVCGSEDVHEVDERKERVVQVNEGVRELRVEDLPYKLNATYCNKCSDYTILKPV